MTGLIMKAGDCYKGYQMNRKRGCEGRVRDYMYMELEDAEYDALSSRQLSKGGTVVNARISAMERA